MSVSVTQRHGIEHDVSYKSTSSPSLEGSEESVGMGGLSKTLSVGTNTSLPHELGVDEGGFLLVPSFLTEISEERLSDSYGTIERFGTEVEKLLESLKSEGISSQAGALKVISMLVGNEWLLRLFLQSRYTPLILPQKEVFEETGTQKTTGTSLSGEGEPIEGESTLLEGQKLSNTPEGTEPVEQEFFENLSNLSKNVETLPTNLQALFKTVLQGGELDKEGSSFVENSKEISEIISEGLSTLPSDSLAEEEVKLFRDLVLEMLGLPPEREEEHSNSVSNSVNQEDLEGSVPVFEPESEDVQDQQDSFPQLGRNTTESEIAPQERKQQSRKKDQLWFPLSGEPMQTKTDKTDRSTTTSSTVQDDDSISSFKDLYTFISDTLGVSALSLTDAILKINSMLMEVAAKKQELRVIQMDVSLSQANQIARKIDKQAKRMLLRAVVTTAASAVSMVIQLGILAFSFYSIGKLGTETQVNQREKTALAENNKTLQETKQKIDTLESKPQPLEGKDLEELGDLKSQLKDTEGNIKISENNIAQNETRLRGIEFNTRLFEGLSSAFRALDTMVNGIGEILRSKEKFLEADQKQLEAEKQLSDNNIQLIAENVRALLEFIAALVGKVIMALSLSNWMVTRQA